jgi:tetraacyldisaccharide 4'-kinase
MGNTAMKAPKFWEKDGIVPSLLSPASLVYKSATRSRLKKPGYKAKVPVVCIGNVVAGGAGKTPTAIALAGLLIKAGKKPHIVSRGYGGNFEGVLKVEHQSPKVVGDEPILLSQAAPTWVCANRVDAVKKAEEAGADIILMDDGFQNPDVEKTFSIMVIDAGYGFGNNRIIPAGPLREPVADAIERTDAIMVVGKQKVPLPRFELPTFKARMDISFPETLREESIVAFCGIGRPKKFFDSLRDSGLNVVSTLEFPDHHFYTEADMKEILRVANEKGAVVVTTEKDIVKVPAHFHMMIYPILAKLNISSHEDLIAAILKKI